MSEKLDNILNADDTPLIVSFHCDVEGQTYYADHAERMFSVLLGMDDSPHIRKLPACDSWLENTRRKASFVSNCMRFFHMPILWIDIDTDIIKPPVYAWDRTADFAAPRFTGQSRLKPELLIRSTAMWFNNTPKAKKLIDDWVERCKTGRYGDHREISNLLHEFDGKIDYMPDSYAHERKQGDSVMVMGMATPVKSRAKEMREIANEINGGNLG